MKAIRVTTMLIFALSLTVGVVYATDHYWTTGDDSDYYLEDNDKIHFYDGDDKLNMGAGNDVIGFSNGTDLVDLSGGFGIITWGLYGPLGGAYPWPDTTLATNYISCNTSDTWTSSPTSMQIRSDEVTVKANTGDVIIQLGN